MQVKICWTLNEVFSDSFCHMTWCDLPKCLTTLFFRKLILVLYTLYIFKYLYLQYKYIIHIKDKCQVIRENENISNTRRLHYHATLKTFNVYLWCPNNSLLNKVKRLFQSMEFPSVSLCSMFLFLMNFWVKCSKPDELVLTSMWIWILFLLQQLFIFLLHFLSLDSCIHKTSTSS